VFRTDLAAFPTELRLDARLRDGRWTGKLCNAHHAVALEEIRSIWNCGPRTYRFSDWLTAAEREFCYREAKLGVGACWPPSGCCGRIIPTGARTRFQALSMDNCRRGRFDGRGHGDH